MSTNRTFTMLKPDAVEKGHIGAILEKISASGFRIVAMKLSQMTKQDAETFYAIHKERPFFGELVEYMTRGPIVAAILHNAGSLIVVFNSARLVRQGEELEAFDPSIDRESTIQQPTNTSPQTA